MATVYGRLDVPSSYRDSRNSASLADQHAQLNASKTLYVGNLSFYTSEEQIHELFRTVGPVRRIIMGLDRHNKTPCGFCFVEYYTHQAALDSLKFISGTKLDERIIRADLDPGYADGRQYGRGRSGGQVRDEFRDDYDVGRGGWGHLRARHEAAEALYREDHAFGGPRDVAEGEADYSRGDIVKEELDDDDVNPRFRQERSEEE